MKEKILDQSLNMPDVDETQNKPTFGDLALIKLNGKPRLVYASDAFSFEEQPEDIQKDIKSNDGKMFVIYNRFNQDSDAKTQMFNALTSLSPGEQTIYGVSVSGKMNRTTMELIDFWSYEEKDVALTEFDKALALDEGRLDVPKD